MSELVPTGSKYTDEDRRNAVTHFLVMGNMSKVADTIQIPRSTLVQWKNESDWWDELYGKLRHEKGEEIDANMSRLIDASFEQAQDRVEHGDYVLAKDGSLVRKPMNGRDLITAGAIVYDKQRLHRNEPTRITGDSETVAQLKAQFEALASNHKAIQASVVDDQ